MTSGRRRYERVDIEPQVGIGVPCDLVGLNRDVLLRRLRQDFRKLAKRRTQFCSRRSFFVVGIQEKGEILARYCRRPVQ
jgi:hypothetical protein